MKVNVNTEEITPSKFFTITKLMQQVSDKKKQDLKSITEMCSLHSSKVEHHVDELAKSYNNLTQQFRLASKQNNTFKPLLDQIHDSDSHKHTFSDANFISVCYETLNILNNSQHKLLNLCYDLYPKELILSDSGVNTKNTQDLQNMMFEIQLNSSAVNKFITSIQILTQIKTEIIKNINISINTFENYYQVLSNRHSVEGLKIYRDPIVTDVAMSIYENVDSHGEIASGKDCNEVSAYTLHKAEVLASVVKIGILAQFIREPNNFFLYIKGGYEVLINTIGILENIFVNEIQEVKSLLNLRDYNLSIKFDEIIHDLEDLNPCNVAYQDKQTILSASEKFNLSFRNETLSEVSRMLVDSSFSVKDLISYILKRKSELQKYFQDENSFYTCKIGAGNTFLGISPGALIVQPSQRPNVTLDQIYGSGFDQIKEFIQTIDSSSKWQDLFIATSPSKSANKSNVLIVGPPGVGKSEIFRAVASEKGSIGIAAQGSDFLTCWSGEAQKNPKRLFEEGLKIQKSSKKHVHFLIDEIDSVLKKQELMSHGETNLTLEFQILMDGVVSYPNLSVWGATNYIERIPTAMIRRFNLVIIVGELSQSDRVNILKQYVNYLPVKEFSDEIWERMASDLEGTTGDIIRKIADHIWRTKMTSFVQNYKHEAMSLVSSLNKDGKFDISTFSEKQRNDFKRELNLYIAVTPDDLDKSIRLHLKNPAIQNEIQVAKKTYADAKRLLNNI